MGLRITCFAFNRGGCNALNVKQCQGADGCRFFKTSAQIQRENAETDRRILERYKMNTKDFLKQQKDR